MTELNRSIFSGMQILTEQKWVLDQAVIVEEAKIKAIIPMHMIKHHLPAKRHEFPSDYYLIPGFIDLHIHGANGKDVMDGTEEALMAISHALAKEGVTGFLATTMTAESERIQQALQAVLAAVTYKEGAAIYGVHLEGPFIAKGKKGAQRGEETLLPDAELIRRWQGLSQDAIRIVTLAPELSGAIEFIKELRDMHIVAAVGHTHATYAETEAAIKAGCTQATHLFNAMSGIHQREAGAAGALLLANEVIAELIVDGIHLSPAVVELALRVKGHERLLLVSDAMRAKCLGDGQYELGGQQVHVRSNIAKLADGTLAGSILRLPEAVKNMVHFTQCSLIEAINMATLNPARVLKLANRKGTIAVGNDADLAVLNAALNVQLTMREGREIYKV